MSKFRFKDYIFKNLLPFYYQHNDTYKDDKGKGILERFMEIGSAYFDGLKDTKEIPSSYKDPILPGLDNLIDLIDVDKTPELFLNYLWEFLGEIPYGYGVIMQGKDPETSKLLSPTDYLGINTRDLLRYAISLYRIRGTEKFYEILGKFYGVEFVVIETGQGGDPGKEETVPVHDHLVLATYTTSNQEESVATYAYGQEDIRAPYPDGTCQDCLYYLVRVKAPLETVLKWQEDSHTQVVKDIVASIISKYLPVHCQIATYNSGDKKVIIEIADEPLFHESFDQCVGKGGNDDLWSGDIALGSVIVDNPGWVNSNANGAYHCLQIGAAKAKGSAKTPPMGFNANRALVTFRAGAWANDSLEILFSVEEPGGSLSHETVTIPDGKFQDFQIECPISEESSLVFQSVNTPNSRFFIDEVKVYFIE